jgi:1,2-diacylglycerol 3-alpha-glucosyltransferase
MRIGMMADVYKPHTSGITNYIALNKHYLEEAGHEVFVFTFGDEDYPDDEPNVIRSPGLPILDTGYYISLKYGREAIKLLRSMDVVHVHHPFLSGSLALRYCRPRGIPLIFTNHTRYDLYAQAYLPVLPEVIGETALQAYLPSFCRACDLVISPSPGMREVLLGLGVDVLIDVVPNGVDLHPFHSPVQPINRSDLSFGAQDVLLIYTGRLGPEKNLSFLLRSFAGIAQAYENVGLIIVGDGPERENLEDYVHRMGIERHVCFTGMVPYIDMPRYLSMADAFVTASVTEVHPLSVIEAMAAGLPVLGIQSPGVGDTIRNGETGYIIFEEDLAAFTAKMARMVTDQEQRKAMGQRSKLAAENYNIEKTTQMMFDRYQKVVIQSASRKRNFRARLFRMLDGWGL